MMNNYEIRIRYLESIQRIIDRLANVSFILKGWAVTLAAGLLALASKDANIQFVLIAYCPTLFFWVLDSEYLKMERQYRILYKQNSDLNVPLHNFKIVRPDENKDDKTMYWQCFFSRTQLLIYLPILITTLIIMITL